MRRWIFDIPGRLTGPLLALAILTVGGFGALIAQAMLDPSSIIALADDDGDDDDDDDDDDDSDSGSGGAGGSGSSGSRSSGSTADTSSGSPSDGGAVLPFLRSLLRPAAPAPAPTPAAPAPTPLPDFAPAEIVAFNLTDQAVRTLEEQGFAVLQREPIETVGVSITRLQVPSGTTLDDARTAVETLQPDAQADFNHFYRPGQATGDEGSQVSAPPATCNDPWCVAPSAIAWPQLASHGNACTPSVSVGLIDTGINLDHTALSDSTITLVTTAPDALAESGRQHGTAVASLLVGDADSRSPGLLANAELIAVDAFYRAGRRDERADVFTLIRSLGLLAERDVGVINLSLAGPANTLLHHMVERLADRNILLVAAAGNGGPRAQPAYPAAYERVFAVTALDAHNSAYRRAGRGEHIDFAAPGVEVWAAASIRGARPRTGTSFATPFMTAALAMLRTAHPDIRSYEQAETYLAAAAQDLGEPGFDPVYGHGLLQAAGLCGNSSAPATAMPVADGPAGRGR